MKTFGIAAMALALFSCFGLNAKGPVLNGTKWKFVDEIFVADVGTMTMTCTLEFTSKKDVTVTWHTHTPSHPGMYMNPDGSVDRIPASDSESSGKGTYVFKRNKLKITFDDGSVNEYEYLEGLFVFKGPGPKQIFNKI